MNKTMTLSDRFEIEDPDACALCGCSFGGIGVWHQKEPKEMWLCEPCGYREQKAGGRWRGEYLPPD